MNSATHTIRTPFVEHVVELRTRLLWVGLVLVATTGAAFSVHQLLLDIIQKPLHQTLYFTSPTGGLAFILQLCLTVGFVLSFPVIFYHTYRFLSPLIIHQKRSTVFFFFVASFVLALLGVIFAYFISLPAALHFLTQFGGENIESLIKADEYFSFALAYLGGFALLFQIPLLVLFTNRITPLKPSKMLLAQRWVIVLSFVAAAVITPTPDPINQALMAAPAIVLYQLSILMVFLLGLRKKSSKTKMAAQPIKTTPVVKPPQKNPAFAKKVLDFAPRNSPAPQLLQAKRRLAARPHPNLARSRPTKSSFSQRQPGPLTGRPIQSIDGII